METQVWTATLTLQGARSHESGVLSWSGGGGATDGIGGVLDGSGVVHVGFGLGGSRALSLRFASF